MGDLPDYPFRPCSCPNCQEFNSCNYLKARMNGKDQKVGWICKKCFYYSIYPLKEVLKN